MFLTSNKYIIDQLLVQNKKDKAGVSKRFSIKGKIANIFSFLHHIASVSVKQLSPCDLVF